METMAWSRWRVRHLEKRVCLVFVLMGLIMGSFSVQGRRADATYQITTLPFTVSRVLGESLGETTHLYTTTFDVERWMVSASLSVPPTANFDLIIWGEFSDEPVSVSASEEGSLEPIYGYDESCVWYLPSPQKVTIGVVAMYGAGMYQLVVHYGPGHKNRTPPPPPEAALHPTPEVNQRWEQWSYARYAGFNGIFFWDEGVLVSLPVPEAPLKQWEENTIRVTYLNQQTGTDGPHQPWNNFDGDGFGVDYGLYKTLEAPPGVYTIQFDVWVYEHASSTSTTIDNWLLLLVDTKREIPAVLWHYWEEPSQARNMWRRLTGTVEIRLHTPNLYVLMGVRDGWAVDHSQGLKFHFESLRLEPSIAPNLLTNPGFETGTFAPWENTDNCACNQIQSEIVHTGQYALQMDSIYSPYPDYKYVVQPLGKPVNLKDDLVLSAAIYPTKTGPTCGEAGVAWVQVVIEEPTINETKTINYEWSGYTYPNNALGANETKAVFLLFDWEPYQWQILHRSILADYTAVFGMPADPSELRVTEVKLLNHAANGEPGTFYADDLILGVSSREAPTITVVSPNGGEYWKGTQPITWTATDPQEEPLTYIVYYSPNGGETWTQVATGLTEPSYEWDTSMVVDGTNYLIKVEASDGEYTKMDISDAAFEIANEPPKTTTTTNTAPTVQIIRPNGGERVHGIYEIQWEANDLDGDTLIFTVYYSPNKGETWTQIAMGVTETAYLWDTSEVRVGENYLIKVEVNDEEYTVEDRSDALFTVERETETETEAAFIPSLRIIEGLGAILVLLGFRKRKRRRAS